MPFFVYVPETSLFAGVACTGTSHYLAEADPVAQIAAQCQHFHIREDVA